MHTPFRQPPEVLFADEFCRPCFQMGPYDNAAMAQNLRIAQVADETPVIDWQRHFGTGDAFTLTANGREAIVLALADLGLARDDEVLIVTTSGSAYVSSCVTGVISRFCRWSRELGERTRAVVLIHEFGFAADLPASVAEAGLPVIEDCAYALGSQNRNGTVGSLGDYVVWSFSKAFPMAYGGLLKSPRPPAVPTVLGETARRQLPQLVAHYLSTLQDACRRRSEFFDQYRTGFAAAGLAPLLEPGPGTVPHSFVLALRDERRAEAIKPRLHAAGIISSVFYGGGGYFLPNHQSLSEAAIDYVVANVLAALSSA